MCTDRNQPEVLCSRSDSRYSGVPCGHSGMLLTHYRPCEVRNSIYRYRKIHIDYWSKFSYRFISNISIIHGNTKGKRQRSPFHVGNTMVAAEATLLEQLSNECPVQHNLQLLSNTWLTLWGWHKMPTAFQTTFSNPISWMKISEFRLKFNWNLVLRGQLTILQHWFR